MSKTIRITVSDHAVGTIDRRLFGSFVEHLGRCVYDGIYEPGHPRANAEGFRTDVMDLVRELGVTAIRYPGGNFVSGFRWEDSVGPRHQRPRRIDLAWHSTETNEVGLDEFAAWARELDLEVIYALNLGTRGVLEAIDVAEYSNLPAGTAIADQRVANGTPEPHNFRMWCLGNEMDGPWQLGHRSAIEYGRIAAQTAKALRQVDPELELVVCGSSSAHMPTFGSWEREVLTETFDDVDFISCHAYYQELDGDRDSFLASAVDMDRFIETVVDIADSVAAERGSDKQIHIAFDEWNVWYQTRFENEEKIVDPAYWPVAPRLLEDQYSVLDAVVFGSLLISLLKHADRVRAASLAQLVNVIAPIMTEPGGPAWRQTTFYPFALTARLAQGRALTTSIEAPLLATKRYGDVPAIDSVVTYDDANQRGAVFLINRDPTTSHSVVIDLNELPVARLGDSYTLTDLDPAAANTLENPDRVTPHANESARLHNRRLSVTLPPISWTAIEVGC